MLYFTHAIIGYGNPDRQDDGVAWHVLAGLAHRLGQYVPRDPEDEFTESINPRLIYTLQLVPEMAETIAGFSHVCFIDAHTGSIPDELKIIPIFPNFESSPFSHHMTPQTLLSFTNVLYQGNPQAVLASIRGYEFGFSRSLSPRTQVLSKHAIDRILQWLTDTRSTT